MLLIEFSHRGVRDPRITDLPIRAGNSLVDLLKKERSGVTVVPTSVEEGRVLSTMEIFGWCTGRLSYGITLLRLSEETGVDIFGRVALRILEEGLKIYHPLYIRPKNDGFKAIFEKLCLCHAMSSSCLFFGIIYENTHDKRYFKLSESIRNTILDTSERHKDLVSDYKNNLSLLTGLSGVLLSISRSKRNLRRRLLLL